jgi:hypothetical protein
MAIGASMKLSAEQDGICHGFKRRAMLMEDERIAWGIRQGGRRRVGQYADGLEEYLRTPLQKKSSVL